MKPTLWSGLAVAAGLALAVAASAQRAKGDRAGCGNLPTGSFTAELNGCSIHYEVRGRGPVLMPVPNSWGLSHEGLMGLYGELEKSFTVVYFDPRGMGGSGPVHTEADMGMKAVRTDFQALRRHLGLGKVTAIGWSNGAVNLIYLASEHPESLNAAVFVHGLARFGEADEKLIREKHPKAYKKLETAYLEMQNNPLPAEEADRRIKRFYVEEYFPSACADPETSLPRLRAAFDGAGFSWRHTLYANKEKPVFDAREDLKAITVPSLVIAGAHDMLPPGKVREIHEGIPGSRFLVFPCSGHFAPVEEPAAFAAAVRDFVYGALKIQGGPPPQPDAKESEIGDPGEAH